MIPAEPTITGTLSTVGLQHLGEVQLPSFPGCAAVQSPASERTLWPCSGRGSGMGVRD